MSGSGAGRGRDLSGLRPVVRAALILAAVASVVAWSLSATVLDARLGPFVVLTGLGVVSRLAQQRHRGPSLNVALIFVGALVLLVDGTLAVWGATIVGLVGLLRGDEPSRVAMSAATLALSQSAAAFARDLTAGALLDQVIVGTTQSGPFAAEPFGVVTALVVGLVLALGWESLRLVSAWLDRRSRTQSARGRSEARWLLDLSLAGTAVMVAVAWSAYAPLVLLLIVPVLTVWRVVAGPVVGMSRGAVGRDELTGLGNAAALRLALTEELVRSEQFEREVSVLFLTLDDEARHQVRRGEGEVDQVLRAIGRAAADVARDYDVVARVGETAFALVLPEAPRAGAHGVGERIRLLLAERPIRSGDREVPVTVSVGVATYPGDATSREGLLTEAELAAEYATLDGGNRVQDAASLPAGFRSNPARRNEADDAAPVTEPLGPDRLVRATFEPLASIRPSSDRLLLVVVALAVLAGGASILVWPGSLPLTVTLLFAGLAVAAEWFAESVYGRASASWAAVPLVALAAYPTTTPLAVALAAVLVGLGGGTLRGVRPRQATYNAAVLLLATLLGWVVARPLLEVGVGGAGGLLAAAAIGVVAGGVFFAVDTLLVAVAIGVSERRSVFDVWREDLLWLVPLQLGMGVLGGAMAFAQERLAAGGTLVFVVPAVGLHLSQRQFVSGSRDHVIELRNARDDMLDANRRILKVNERLTDALEQVNAGYLVTVESLAAAVDTRDGYAGGHTERVEAYGRRLLEVLDPTLADDEGLLWGFRLHELGKVGVPDQVLQKPGPLDDAEWALVKRHPELGAQLVASAPFLQGARDVILHHHERWDGQGYPYGLSAEAIPFAARVFAVVDTFEALTVDRPYRAAVTVEEALQELVRVAGSQLDPQMVDAFLQIPTDDLAGIRQQAEPGRAEGRGSRSGSTLIRVSGFEDLADLVAGVDLDGGEVGSRRPS